MCLTVPSLNDEEDLTHMGQSLSTLDKFDDYVESDEDESGVMSGICKNKCAVLCFLFCTSYFIRFSLASHIH